MELPQEGAPILTCQSQIICPEEISLAMIENVVEVVLERMAVEEVVELVARGV